MKPRRKGVWVLKVRIVAHHFDLFVTDIAEKMNFPAEFIKMAKLLGDKTLAFHPEGMKDEATRIEKRKEIANLAYTLLQYWSGLGNDLFPSYLKGVVEMKLLYIDSKNTVES